MSTENKIAMFIKQNDSIFSSLSAKNINFTRTDISEIINLEDKLLLLIDENNKLKEIIKNNKPIQPINVKKLKPIQIAKNIIKENDNNNEEETIANITLKYLENTDIELTFDDKLTLILDKIDKLKIKRNRRR